MANNLTHTLAIRLANRLNVYDKKEGLEYTKMVLGIEIWLINIPKMIIIISVAVVMGLILESLIVFGTFAIIRRYASGLHAKSSIVCTFVSVGMFVAIPWLVKGIGIGNHIVIAVFLISSAVFYIFAPADTEARPILGARNRLKLKYKCLAVNSALFALALFIDSENIKLLIALGIAYGVVAVSPITYKILKRRRKNYENHE